MDGQSDIVGAAHDNVRHDSARKHVSGEAVYIDDMPRLPGTLETVLVTSPHAHADIKSIQVEKALAQTGVRAVLTADDIPGKNDIAPIFSEEPL